jgi:hypothetical protein
MRDKAWLLFLCGRLQRPVRMQCIAILGGSDQGFGADRAVLEKLTQNSASGEDHGASEGCLGVRQSLLSLSFWT